MVFIKALILSDLHYVPYEKWKDFLKIPQETFDFILSLGDIEIHYLRDIANTFSNKTILGVHGNHDYKVDLNSYELNNLHGKIKNIFDKSILGIEGCLRYKKSNRPMHSQEEIIELLENKNTVDIVISHNSPKGIHDKEDIVHEGFIGLSNYIVKQKPSYVFHGHQHKNQQTKIKETLVTGVFGGIIFDFSKKTTEYVLSIE